MNIRVTRMVVSCVLSCCVGLTAQAQRRSTEGASPAGQAATILFRAEFEDAGDAGFKASAYGSAKYLTGKYKEEADLAKVEGFTVAVAGRPETAYGSQGALKIAVSQPDAKSVTAERYFDWPADGTTVALLIYGHGVSGCYVQGWGKIANRSLHAEIQVAKQDEWQFVKLNVPAFVGWGGGSVSSGELFRNLMIVAHERDASVSPSFLLVDNLVVYQGADTVPPSAPAEVKAAVEPKGGITLTWKPATDDVCVAAYEVHRSAEAVFKPASKTRIAAVCALQYTDREAPAGQTCHYVIIAKDAGGNKTAAPAVAIVAPGVAAPAVESGKKEEF